MHNQFIERKISMSGNEKEIFLSNYKTPNYWITHTDLEIDLSCSPVVVTAKLTFERNEEHGQDDLVLNGTDLDLRELLLDGKTFDQDHYELRDGDLYLKHLPVKGVLTTVVEISPEKNFTGEGLYKSGHIFCTQCEAEGFRRITFYLDRPDVMSYFTTKLIANKKDYPYLLSNGDKIEAGDLDDGLHFAIWGDPHKKPCYLFACVFGNLGLVKDTYQTKSARDVALEIYVDLGNEDKCEHAMRSLKNSMRWDEDIFGLEYDLDTYMIVAVDSFNMGAMENKGLNIFNSEYVLAKETTATDTNFQGIEGVIAHEYFHNWTGNRVTCRDWFQLTLKEGLTVFRDQEFSADMLDRSVKRIEDVKGLRAHQFPEDAGPMSHPIQPKSFVEISNFYTSTIYEKGAEIIRMIHTLVGKKAFRAGMDLYFERHDGQAVTTQDFVAAMADASGHNLDHFKVWYDQNGTPRLKVELFWDKSKKTAKLICQQENLQLNNKDYDCLYFPFHLSLYTEAGKKIELPQNGHFVIHKKEQVFEFTGIDSSPVPSFNENYTAPIIVDYDYSQNELMVLMQWSQDDFNRYDACQILTEIEIEALRKQSMNARPLKVSCEYKDAYRNLLINEQLSPSFRAFALSIPSLGELNNKRDLFDFDHLPKAIEILKQSLALELENELNTLVFKLEQKGSYELTDKAMGERALKNFCLSCLSHARTPAAFDLIYAQYQSASNMTDEISALAALAFINNPYREKALEAFYRKWKSEPLVIQKWFRAQVSTPLVGVAEVQKLMQNESYDEKIPNFFRALVASFVVSNFMGLHQADGSGYKFVADQILHMDKINPQLAAGLAKSQRFLNKLDTQRANLLKQELMKVRDSGQLSNDTLEVLNKNLSFS